MTCASGRKVHGAEEGGQTPGVRVRVRVRGRVRGRRRREEEEGGSEPVLDMIS